MPEMDGYQATARLRSQARFAALPIVAMTAHATIEERQRCVAAGMNDHVAKPIDPAALYDVLSRYRDGPAALRRRPPRAPRPSRPPRGCRAVDGLDAAQGLRRVAGNRKLYLSLLRQFVDGHADAAERIRESLGRGERAVAERLAHTVKGTAGNLAAGPVQAAAGALEKAIRDGVEAARVESLRAQLGEALGRLSSALRPVAGGRGRRAGARGRPRPPRRSTRLRSRRWWSAGLACSRSATRGPATTSSGRATSCAPSSAARRASPGSPGWSPPTTSTARSRRCASAAGEKGI